VVARPETDFCFSGFYFFHFLVGSPDEQAQAGGSPQPRAATAVCWQPSPTQLGCLGDQGPAGIPSALRNSNGRWRTSSLPSSPAEASSGAMETLGTLLPTAPCSLLARCSRHGTPCHSTPWHSTPRHGTPWHGTPRRRCRSKASCFTSGFPRTTGKRSARSKASTWGERSRA